MSTDPKPDLVVIGRVGRPHGVDGAFVVEGASQEPERFEVGAELLVNGEPARVVLCRRVGGRRFAVLLDRAVARGMDLAVPRERLPELPPDSYYVFDLVGLDVLDDKGSVVGRIRDVLPGPANDVLELDNGRLLPLVEDCVRDVDLVQGRVLLNPGFID